MAPPIAGLGRVPRAVVSVTCSPNDNNYIDSQEGADLVVSFMKRNLGVHSTLPATRPFPRPSGPVTRAVVNRIRAAMDDREYPRHRRGWAGKHLVDDQPESVQTIARVAEQALC